MILHFFGGSFDPPHLGHLAVVKYFSTRSDLVLVCPLLTSQEKSPNASAELRLQMCEIAFQGIQKVQVTSIDIERGGVTYTIDSIKDIQKAYPGAEIHLVIGEDALSTIHHWKDVHTLMECVKLDVVKRPGSQIEDSVEFPFTLHDIGSPDISSSSLRTALQSSDIDEDILGSKIPIHVLQFIRKNRLYQV